MHNYTGLLGILACFGVAVAFSHNRRRIPWKLMLWSLLMQFAFVFCILGIPRLGVPGVGRLIFDGLNSLVTQLTDFTDSGADFVFGPLGKPGGPLGFIFAFRALPSIIFFSSLTAVLYHLRLLQPVVRGISYVMQRTFKSSGAETLSTAANIFLGQTEAPLWVRPYLARMTRSEMFCVMVGGMATVAAGVMGAYVSMLKARIPDIAGHLLTASFMAAPATIAISKVLIPESEEPETAGRVRLKDEKIDTNAIEAAARGASEGVQLAINVAAMLIAFIALIAMADSAVAFVCQHLGVQSIAGHPPTLSTLTGYVLSPFAWLMGIPWNECMPIGRLLGEKVVLNEFVAYVHLAEMAPTLSDRTLIVTSYALCGFANFSSIGIQLGGIGTLAPEQKPTLSRLGLLAVLGGTLSTVLTAAVASLLY